MSRRARYLLGQQLAPLEIAGIALVVLATTIVMHEQEAGPAEDAAKVG